MNQQIQPEKPALKKQALLVNLSLIAYACLLFYFLSCILPNELFNSLFIKRAELSSSPIFMSNASDLNSDHFQVVYSTKYHSNPNTTTAEGSNVSDIGSISSVISGTITNIEGDEFVSFGTIDGSTSDGKVIYYANSDSMVFDQYIQITPSITHISLHCDTVANSPFYPGYGPAIIQPVVSSSSFYFSTNEVLSYINTATSFLWGIIPCLLLLLYVWKFHEYKRGKLFMPLIFGTVSIGYVCNSLSILVDFFKVVINFFTYDGNDHAIPVSPLNRIPDLLINLALPAAMAVCYVIMTIHSRTGSVNKKWLIITAVVSTLHCIRNYSYFSIPDSTLIFRILYGANILGHVLFYVTLLLHAFFNLLPKKDDDKEEPSEPIIESKNMAPPPQPAQ